MAEVGQTTLRRHQVTGRQGKRTPVGITNIFET